MSTLKRSATGPKRSRPRFSTCIKWSTSYRSKDKRPLRRTRSGSASWTGRQLMTKTELNKFRRALENLQAELRNGSRSREALAIETSSDELDRVQDANDRDYAMSNLERTSSRLREVRSALRRVEEGTFGICAGC